MFLTRTNRIFLIVSFGIYCFIYPSSLFLLMTDGVPAGTEWMASLMLILEGLVATAWVIINYGPWRGFCGALAVLFGAFTVEAIGVSTGFPFGQYEYTNVLAPKLLVVPIGIMFAWLMMILSSFFMAHFIVERLWPRRGLPTVIVLSASMALASDLLMEPVAVHIQGYWTWLDNGSYYGVPTSNFIAWGVTSLLLVLMLSRIVGANRTPRLSKGFRYRFIPMALFMMNLVMFAAINLTHGNYLAGFIGAVAGGLCAFLIGRAQGLDLIRLNLRQEAAGLE